VVKKSQRFQLDDVRERFRLTSIERRVVLFVAAAFVLGLATKCYRDAHPSPAPVETHPGRTVTSLTRNTSEANQTRAMKPGDPAKRRRKSAEKDNLPDLAQEQHYQQK